MKSKPGRRPQQVRAVFTIITGGTVSEVYPPVSEWEGRLLMGTLLKIAITLLKHENYLISEMCVMEWSSLLKLQYKLIKIIVC